MADRRREIEVSVRLRDLFTKVAEQINDELGQTEKQSKRTRRELSLFDRSMNTLSRGITGVVKRLFSLRTAFVGLVSGIGGTLLVRNLANAAAQVDIKGREIVALFSERSEEALAKVNGVVRRIAVEGANDIESAYTAAYNAISAGVPLDNLETFLRSANELAIAGVATVQESTDLLLTTFQAFGEGAGTSQQATDSLFQTIRAGRTTIPEFATQFGRVAPSAAALGLTLNETNATIAAYTLAQGDAVRGTTQFQALLRLIQAPTKRFSDLLQDLGVDLSAAAIESRGFENVILDLAKAYNENEALFKQANVLSSESFNALASIGQDGGEALRSAFDSFNDAAGQASEAAAFIRESFDFQFRRAGTAVRLLAADVGTLLAPSLADAANAVTEISNLIGLFLDGTITGRRVQGFGDFFYQLSNVINGEAAPEVRKALGEFFAGMEVAIGDGIEGVTKIIAVLFFKLIDAVVILITSPTALKTLSRAFTRFIVELYKSVSQILLDSLQGQNNIVVNSFLRPFLFAIQQSANAIELVENNVGALATRQKEIEELVTRIVNNTLDPTALGLVGQGFVDIERALGGASGAAKKFATDLIQSLVDAGKITQVQADAIVEKLDNIRNAAGGAAVPPAVLTFGLGSASNFFDAFIDKAGASAEASFRLKDAFANVAEYLGGKFANIFVDVFGNQIPNALAETIVNWEFTGETFVNIGRQIIQQLLAITLRLLAFRALVALIPGLGPSIAATNVASSGGGGLGALLGALLGGLGLDGLRRGGLVGRDGERLSLLSTAFKGFAGFFAGGGMIPGVPNPSGRDDLLIGAQAGEFMQPVPTVDYYGRHIMEAIKHRLIPRDVLAPFAVAARYPAEKVNFADGGEVGTAPRGDSVVPAIIADENTMEILLNAGGNALLRFLKDRKGQY